MSKPLKSHVFAFDLDGTIYTGNTLIVGADEVVHFLRQLGAKVVFFTNSSTRTVQDVYEKLTRMKLEPVFEDIYTSARAAAIYASCSSITKVFCIGTNGLKAELRSFGIEILDTVQVAEALVIGLDPEFTYAHIAAVMSCCNAKCKIIACNRDRSYPIENNSQLPGCGPIVAAIENAIGRTVDFIAGKPNTFMLDLLSKQLGCRNTDITVVGDSYESDIEMAKNYGSKSFFISGHQSVKLCNMTQISDIREIITFLGGY